MGWPHLAACTSINMYVDEHCCAKSFSDTSNGKFSSWGSCTAHEPARSWFLGIILFPDNKSVQPQFIALHLTKEINVCFVCLKSTNSVKGMTHETRTQELVHAFNPRFPRETPWKTDCAAHWEWCQKPLPSTRAGQISKCLSRLIVGKKIPASPAGPWFLLCTQKCSAWKSPHLQGPPAAKGSWLDLGTQQSITWIPQRIHPSLWY